MNLSNVTVSVLKNFATINQNLVIKEGSNISTMSAMKNIIASAEVKESFPLDFAIYDLNEFLAALSLFEKPDLDFHKDFVVMTESGSTGKSLKYWYSDPSVVTTPTKEISMPESEVSFTLENDMLINVQKAAAVIGAPDMVLEGMDKFWFKVENLRLLSGSYGVEVSSKNISRFVNTNVDIQYWIALEPESSYDA